jgi:hypothetical protein
LGARGLTNGNNQWQRTRAEEDFGRRCGWEVVDGEGVGIVELQARAVLHELVVRPEVYRMLSVTASFLLSGTVVEEEAQVGVVAVGSSCNHVQVAKVEAAEPLADSCGDGHARWWSVIEEQGGGESKARRQKSNGREVPLLSMHEGISSRPRGGGGVDDRRWPVQWRSAP